MDAEAGFHSALHTIQLSHRGSDASADISHTAVRTLQRPLTGFVSQGRVRAEGRAAVGQIENTGLTHQRNTAGRGDVTDIVFFEASHDAIGGRQAVG